MSIGCARRVALRWAYLWAQVALGLAGHQLLTGAGGTFCTWGDRHGSPLEDFMLLKHGLEADDCRWLPATC